MRRDRIFRATRTTGAAQPVSIRWRMAATGVCTADFIGSIQRDHPWPTMVIPRGQVKTAAGLRLLTRGIMLTRPYRRPPGSTRRSPITNSWNNVNAPIQETAGIDQTAPTNLTFYMIGTDPGGAGPLVIQGVFNPGSTPTQPSTPVSDICSPQVQNATVVSTTAYSVTWSNGMTFTNLTPQSSMSESLFQQAAALDSTFNPAYLSSFNCGLTGAESQGAFFLACYIGGADPPGSVFAFTPGDGSPAPG